MPAILQQRAYLAFMEALSPNLKSTVVTVRDIPIAHIQFRSSPEQSHGRSFRYGGSVCPQYQIAPNKLGEPHRAHVRSIRPSAAVPMNTGRPVAIGPTVTTSANFVLG